MCNCPRANSLLRGAWCVGISLPERKVLGVVCCDIRKDAQVATSAVCINKYSLEQCLTRETSKAAHGLGGGSVVKGE